MIRMQFTTILVLFFAFMAPFAHAQKTPEELLEELNRLPCHTRQSKLNV